MSSYNSKDTHPKKDQVLELDDKELATLMAAEKTEASPPEGLLESLLEDIPQDPSFQWADETAELDGSEVSETENTIIPANDNGPRYWRWGIAASLFMALGMGSMLYRQGAMDSRPELKDREEIVAVTVIPPPEEAGESVAYDMNRSAMKQRLGASGATERAAAPKLVTPKMQLPSGARSDAGSAPPSRRMSMGIPDAPPSSIKEETQRFYALETVSASGAVVSRDAAPSDGVFAGRIEMPTVSDSPSTEALKGQKRVNEAGATLPIPRPKAKKVPIPDATPEERLRREVTVMEAKAQAEPESEGYIELSEDAFMAEIPDPPPVAELIGPVPAPAPSKPVSASTPVEEAKRAAMKSTMESALKKLDSFDRTQAGRDARQQNNFFEAEPHNPFIDTDDDAQSTFGLDVDTGSYTVVRDFLRHDSLPPKAAVRVEEMVNYFDYQDPAPAAGEGDFAFTVQGSPSIYGEGERYYLMRVGLKGREVNTEDRPPALLTFVVDVSGSMSRGDRLGLVKQSLTLLVGEMRSEDRMALVVYGSRGRVLLEPTSDAGKILDAISRLVPEGSTNADEGLRLAYKLAAQYRRPGEINRLILCSDGVANVGDTTADAILANVKHHADQGVELTTVGFGMGNYNDLLMERLADRGNGRYAYVDTLSEAHKLFVEDLTGTLQTIAAEARSQVEFNPKVVSRYRLLGYENRAIADHLFRDDTVDAGEIGAGHTVTALYELKTHRVLKNKDRVATVRLRYASVEQKKMVEQEVDVRGAQFSASWDKAPKALKLTALVAELAEILRGSFWARDTDPQDVFVRLQKVSAEYGGDPDVAEAASLAGKVSRLRGLMTER